MELPRRGSSLPAPILHDEGVQSSQGTRERGRGGVFAATARVNNVLCGVDQGVPYEVHIVSDDDEGTLHRTPPSLPSTGDTSSQLSCTEAINQPGREAQVDKSARKRKRKSGARDESIASAMNNFLEELLEVEKRKLKMWIDHERECREMELQGQQQMTAIILEALKAAMDSSK